MARSYKVYIMREFILSILYLVFLGCVIFYLTAMGIVDAIENILRGKKCDK